MRVSKEELVGDGRRSGSMEIVVFGETAGEIDPGTTSMRESHPEQGRRDRGRQRQDLDPRLRPKTPERSGSALEETEATGSSGSSDAGPLGEEPEGHLGSMPKLEARRQARLHSIMPRQGFGRTRGVEARFTCESLVERVIRESNDPWGARIASRLQTLEERIFPSGAERAARPESQAQGQLDAAALR